MDFRESSFAKHDVIPNKLDTVLKVCEKIEAPFPFSPSLGGAKMAELHNKLASWKRIVELRVVMADNASNLRETGLAVGKLLNSAFRSFLPICLTLFGFEKKIKRRALFR